MPSAAGQGKRGGKRGGRGKGGRAAAANAAVAAEALKQEGDEMAKGDACAGCGEPATKRCARCKEVWYCGSECQRKHWKEHKSECRTAKATAKKKLKEAKRRGALEPEGPEGAALLPPPPPGTVLHSYAAFRGLWGDAGGGGGGAGGRVRTLAGTRERERARSLRRLLPPPRQGRGLRRWVAPVARIAGVRAG